MNDEQTREFCGRIEQAVREALPIIAPDGSFLTGYVLMAKFLDSDGDQGWAMATPVSQDGHMSRGMAAHLHDLICEAFEADDD